jgi:hypothetical protein
MNLMLMNTKKILGKFYSIFSKKNKLDNQLLIECRQTVNADNGNPSTSSNQYTDAWNNYLCEFKKMINSEDIHQFLRTPVVRDTMFFEAPLVEFKRVIGNWSFFKNALVFNPTGYPYPYALWPFTNGNTVHHLFSISQKFKSNEELAKIHSVIEFGGGYGNMAWCFDRIGFRGSYIIFDDLKMNALQELFLQESRVENIKELRCIHKYSELLDLISAAKKGTLLIATWSLSETPIEIRDAVMGNDNLSFLIAFQGSFEGVDNLAYFRKYKINNSKVNIYEIKHIPDNYYLIKTN